MKCVTLTPFFIWIQEANHTQFLMWTCQTIEIRQIDTMPFLWIRKAVKVKSLVWIYKGSHRNASRRHYLCERGQQLKCNLHRALSFTHRRIASTKRSTV